MDNKSFFYKSIFNSLRKSFARVGVIAISLFIGACVASAFLNILLDIESKLSNELKVYGANFIISPAHGQNHIDSQTYKSKIAEIPKDKLKVAAPFLYGFFSLGNNSAIVAGVDFSAIKAISPFIEVHSGHFGNSVFDEKGAFVGVSLAKSAEIKVGDKITLTNQKTLESKDLEVKGIIASGDEIDGIILAPIKVVQSLVGNSSLGLHSADFADFGEQQTQSLVLSPKSTKNHESQTENPSVVDSAKSQNLIKSAESSQKNNTDSANKAQQTIEGIAVEVAEFLPNLGCKARLESAQCPKFGKSPQDAPKSKLSAESKPFIHYAKLILYGNFAEVKQIGANLSDDLVSAKPIAQVSISEGIVLGKIKALMLLICLIILLIASLSVNTSLSSIIFARKKEVALHLSLGAKKAQIAKLFGAEVLFLALISSVVGALCGYLLANLLGFIIFNSSVSFRILSVVGAVAITLISAFLASFYPIKKALNINIITNLKGD